MIHYTLGIVFKEGLSEVLLMEKRRPQWQNGQLNAPGGRVESGENYMQCMVREFLEETGLDIPPKDWLEIGSIKGETYQVRIFTAIYHESHGHVNSWTDEKVKWYLSLYLPANVIRNLRWLIPFATNFHYQTGPDTLAFGTFDYNDK